jgi:hypothetical protein
MNVSQMVAVRFKTPNRPRLAAFLFCVRKREARIGTARDCCSEGTGSLASGFPCMKEILSHEFASFAQPGALIAMFLVLLALGIGDAAIAIAARGWPF